MDSPNAKSTRYNARLSVLNIRRRRSVDSLSLHPLPWIGINSGQWFTLSLSLSAPTRRCDATTVELCRGAAWRNVVQNAQQIRAWFTPSGSGGFARAFSACTGNSRRWEIGQPGKIIRELCAKSWKGDGQFPPEREGATFPPSSCVPRRRARNHRHAKIHSPSPLVNS